MLWRNDWTGLIGYLFIEQVRGTVADFAVFLSVTTWTSIDYLIGIDTPKLNVPSDFKPTRDDRFLSFWSLHSNEYFLTELSQRDKVRNDTTSAFIKMCCRYLVLCFFERPIMVHSKLTEPDYGVLTSVMNNVTQGCDQKLISWRYLKEHC